jgi:GR25 family glycosyltransferase involved in LPS biosynthesis
LVLEDDVCFFKEFKHIMKALRETPDDFNILHLEGFFLPANEEQKSRYLTHLTQKY